MQTINELLNRIHWDPEFGEGEFEIAFLDRVEQEMIRLPFRKVSFIPGEHFFFYYLDEDAVEHSVPLHRIKAVYKNGQCIWQREH